MRPTFDDRDQAILTQRLSQWNQRAGPRVGDFVRFPDGSLHRFTHAWDDGLQTAPAGHGSYYLGEGFCSYSGSLDPLIPSTRIHATDATEDGRIWFFHHDYWCAHNGVVAMIPCRVYQLG